MNNNSLTQNKELAQLFLQLLCGRDDASVIFQTFDDDEDRKAPEFIRTIQGTLNGKWEELKRLNNKGAGVFVTVQKTDGTGKRATENITGTRAFFVDCDNGLPDEWHLEPTMIISSSPEGNKGHAYWVLEDSIKLSKDEFRSYQKRLIAMYDADEKPCDLARVLRLPGTLNRKPEYDCPLVDIPLYSGIRYSLDSVFEGVPQLEAEPKKAVVKEAAPAPAVVPIPAQPTSVTTPAASDDFEPWLRHVLSQLVMLSDGNRNNTLNQLAFHLFSTFPQCYEQVLGRLVAVSAAIGLSESEATTTIKSAHNGALKDIEAMGKIKSVLDLANLLGVNKNRGNSDLILKQELRLAYGGRVAWDEMRLELLLDGKPMQQDDMLMNALDTLGHNVSRDLFPVMIKALARENPKHAVRDYISSLDASRADLVNLPALNKLFDILGITDATQRAMMKRWLIAAIARATNPGCKVDNLLVLYGGQGIGKTTFFNTLAGAGLFQTVGDHKSETDELMALASSWICEYGEVETAMNRKEISQLKQFITKQEDIYREPYASSTGRHPRAFVLCGSTNNDVFLRDTTGNRRYWVVEVSKRIDNVAVAALRDDIWTEAKALYEAGEPWWMNSIEEVAVAKHNEQFTESDPLETAVYSFAACHRSGFTVFELMSNLGYTPQQMSKAEQNRYTNILKGLGGEKKRMSVKGKRDVFWLFSDDIFVTKRSATDVLAVEEEDEESVY